MMYPDTHAELLAAIRAELQADPTSLGYAGKSAAEIAALMNAPQPAPVPQPEPRPFRWRQAKAIAQMHVRWAFIVLRARGTPAVPPTTAADWATVAAINATSMADDQEIDPTDAAKWTAFTDGLAAFVTSGDLTQPIADEIAALGTYQPPQPPPLPARWSLVIDGLSAAPTPETAEGEDPHPGYAGPPNAADETLIAEALNG